MLSHIVTAAKGLFSTPEPTEGDQSEAPHDQGSTVLPERPKVMVSTRRTRYGTADAENSADIGAPSPGRGKRKSRSAQPNGAESQAKKRKTSPEGDSAVAVVVNVVPDTRQNGPIIEETGSSGDEGSAVVSSPAKSKSPRETTAKSTHMRFDSEEPISIPKEDEDAIPEMKAPEPADDESSDDDEAPEALDNSTQLANVKAAQQNAEQAKLRHEKLQREKRKERDQRLKSQAVSKKSKELPNPRKAHARAPEHDDMMSESTATLQDLGFKDSHLLAGQLPALLPDEILNAEPVARLPTPVSENDRTKPRISQKRKFLDEEQKPPKDVRRGGTTIRVLDGSSGKANALAPKVSKPGKHVREQWLSGNRGGVGPSGLRRAGGGSKGFVGK
ncbi:hypothetical protein FQN54_005195 [Arachnomyces sp. PD_36]|nr:hypothetical protein FQN54_005195 [Arachnomyces sp. PD_36]